jgi:hypothetical protein
MQYQLGVKLLRSKETKIGAYINKSEKKLIENEKVPESYIMH